MIFGYENKDKIIPVLVESAEGESENYWWPLLERKCLILSHEVFNFFK